MFRTIFNATSHAHSGALTTNQFLPFESIVVILSHFAILFPTKVWLLTLKALVVRELVKSVGFDVLIVNIRRVVKLLILVQIFEFSSIQSLFYHNFL